jgi:phosphoribosyl 1,2-cyclic phosphodiesterase
VLATSSAGNSIYIRSRHTRLLVDAGLSRKEIVQRLGAIGEDAERLDGVLVTHEHSDHVCGLPALSRGLGCRVPVYLTRLTAPAIEWNGAAPPLVEFQAGASFSIGDIAIQSFTTPHDAADPVGFTFETAGLKVGLAMDLGYLPDSIKFHLRGAQLVVLESNHDVEMLKVGPYPWQVKQRVMGRKGHLSNDAVSDFIRQEMDGAVETLLLGHLSEQNNHPALVRLAAEMALAERGASGVRLVVVEPKSQTEIYTLG